MLLHARVLCRCNGGIGTVWINIWSLYHWLALGRPQSRVVYVSWSLHPEDVEGTPQPGEGQHQLSLHAGAWVLPQFWVYDSGGALLSLPGLGAPWTLLDSSCQNGASWDTSVSCKVKL